MPAKAKKWLFPRPCEDNINILVRELRVQPALAKVLINRGISTPREARCFLNPSMDELFDPFLMKDMAFAVDLIIRMLRTNQKIMVYGDYDADGITAASLLNTALKRLGGDVSYYLPSRFTGGYGLQKNALQQFSVDGYKLVITVDCGINSFSEIAYCRDVGMDIIVSDHHFPIGSHELPGVPVINPLQKDCSYPEKALSGVGVAYKIICALLERMGNPFDHREYLDLVALGTIADIVPLLGENRILTFFGMQKMNQNPLIGLQTLIDVVVTGHQPAQGTHSGTSRDYANTPDDNSYYRRPHTNLNSRDVAFKLAPYINAAGRMGEAYPAAELLMSEDTDKADTLVRSLKEINDKRREIEGVLFHEARMIIEEEYNGEPDEIVVLAKEDWHVGVTGIVASKLVSIYGVPVALISIEGETGKGSARSVPGFNITHALENCSGFLNRFGGHQQAAGFSLDSALINDFREALVSSWNGRPNPEDTGPVIQVDAELAPHEISMELAEKLKILEPHGAANQPPIFCIGGWKVEDFRLVGRDQSHLKLNLFKRESSVSTIFFGAAGKADSLKTGLELDLVVALKKDFWQDRPTLSVEVKDMVLTEEIKAVQDRVKNVERKEDRLRTEGAVSRNVPGSKGGKKGSNSFLVPGIDGKKVMLIDHRNKGRDLSVLRTINRNKKREMNGNRRAEKDYGTINFKNSYVMEERIAKRPLANLNKVTILKGICNSFAETVIYIGNDSEKEALEKSLASLENISFIHARSVGKSYGDGNSERDSKDSEDQENQWLASGKAARQLVFYHLPILPAFFLRVFGRLDLNSIEEFNICFLYNEEDRFFNEKILAAATPSIKEITEFYHAAKNNSLDKLSFEAAPIKIERILTILQDSGLISVSAESDRTERALKEIITNSGCRPEELNRHLTFSKPGFVSELLKESKFFRHLQEQVKESADFQEFMLNTPVTGFTEYIRSGMVGIDRD